MATQSLYLTQTVAGSSNHLALDTVAPGTATSATGWTVGTTAAGNYSAMAAGVERAAATFGTTILPDNSGPNNTLGDCFRTPSLATGRYKAGNWTLTFPLIAVTAGGAADVRIRVRVWKSTDPTGAGAVEILTQSGLDQVSQANVGTPDTNVGTGAAQNSVVTIAMPYFGLHGEYLFVQVVLEITGAGAGATDDVLIRVGSSAVIVTTDWKPATLTQYGAILDGDGLLLLQESNGWRRALANEFAAKQATGALTNADRLNDSVIEQTSWVGGGGLLDFVTSPGDRFNTGYGVDPISTPGKLQVGPGLIASRSSANNAARVFGTYNSQLYVGYSTGQVDRQTATDTWSAAVGTITSNRAVTGIVESLQTMNNVTARAWISNGTNAQLASYNGTTFTNNAADANVGPNALTYISCLRSWINYITGTNTYTDVVIGGKRTSDGLAVIGVAYGATATTWATHGAWDRSTLQVSTNGCTDVTAMLLGSDNRFYWACGNPSSIIGQVFIQAQPVSGGTPVAPFADTPLNAGNQIDDYITSFAELNNIIYAISYANRLYKIVSDKLVLLASNIDPSAGQLYGLTAWNNVLWVSCRSGTGLLVRRFGPPDPTNLSTDESTWVWSEPIYGGAIDASATAARQLTPFGGFLYAATEAAGASKIYRVDKALYNTSVVTLESSNYDADLPGLDKLFKKITVVHSALLSGESVQVKYRTNGTGTWLTAGTSSALGATSATFTLPTAIGTTVAVQIILTAATSAATPMVASLTIAYQPHPDTRYEWELVLDLIGVSGSPAVCRDYSQEPWTGLEVSASIWATVQRGWSVKFTDIDGVVRDVLPKDWTDNLSSKQGTGGYRLESNLGLLES